MRSSADVTTLALGSVAAPRPVAHQPPASEQPTGPATWKEHVSCGKNSASSSSIGNLTPQTAAVTVVSLSIS